MSETISTTVKSTNLKHASASGNNVVLDSSGNTSLSGNLAVTGTTTLTGAVELPDDTVDIADLSATGTASSSTYLRGDNTWSTPASGANSPCFFGRQDTAHAVATTTWTKLINMGTNPINIGSGWDESVGRFTCGSGDAGIYLFYAGGSVLNLDAGDNIQARFTLNGSEYGGKSINYQENGNHVLTGQMQTMINLSVNDYVEFEVRHNEGSSENTNEEFCWIGGFKLIGVP